MDSSVGEPISKAALEKQEEEHNREQLKILYLRSIREKLLDMVKVEVEISNLEYRLVKSPFNIIFTGMSVNSITFVPLFLHWSCEMEVLAPYKHIMVPVCFGIILVIGMYYFMLGMRVVKAVRKKNKASQKG